MPQQAEVTFVKDLPKNGNIPKVTQTYVDAATAQVKKCDMGAESEAPVGASEDHSCGWGPFSPKLCQRFRDPRWMCFWLSWAGAIQVRIFQCQGHQKTLVHVYLSYYRI